VSANGELGRRWGARRIADVTVLAAWCGLFWFLLATDRTSLYLSDRTAWVVPVGAVILSFAVLGLAWGGRRDETSLTRSHLGGLVVLLLPVVIVIALPPAALGSFAASRRSSLVSGGFVASAIDVASGPVTQLDIVSAGRSPEAMEALKARAGTSVEFVGFVRRDPADPPDRFTLTRFIMSCCVADALSVDVAVVGAGETLPEDQWVRVKGNIYPVGNEIVVDAAEVEPIERPGNPYLSP